MLRALEMLVNDPCLEIMHGRRPITRSMTLSHPLIPAHLASVQLLSPVTPLRPSRAKKRPVKDSHRPKRPARSLLKPASKPVRVDDHKLEVGFPPTPESLPRQSRGSGKRKWEIGNERSRRAGPRAVGNGGTGLPPTPSREVDRVLAFSEEGRVEPVGKILLLQERVRHDPWKLLVACCLLNKTSGRAARPVFSQILDKWPTPQALYEAAIPDLAEVLYPIGLFNQRASSLVRMSGQYISLGWPSARLRESGASSSMGLGRATEASSPDYAGSKSRSRHAPGEALPSPVRELDVNVFHGAGRYASDSFRIYSPLLPGKGGPEGEEKWVAKRARAVTRMRAGKDKDGGRKRRVQMEESSENAEEWEEGAGDGEEEIREDPGVEEVGEWLSEDDEDDSGAEWRQVRANDKELRRYLIWRWALEGIVYDIHRGPLVLRERDKRRLFGMAHLGQGRIGCVL